MIKTRIDSKLTRFAVSGFNLVIAIVVLWYVLINKGQYALPVVVVSMTYYLAILSLFIFKYRNTNRETKSGKVLYKWIRDTILYIAIVVFYLILHFNNLNAENISLDQDVSKAAASTKLKHEFPYKLNESSSLVDITTNNRKIMYHVEVIDTLNLDNTYVEDLREKSIIPSTCSNSGIKTLLERGATVEYIFKQQKKSTDSFTISIDKNNCDRYSSE